MDFLRYLRRRGQKLTLIAYISLFAYLAPSTSGRIAESSCSCKACPCFCPCIDRCNFRVGFLQYHDDGLRFKEASTRTSFTLASGVRQAARDRGLQLNFYKSRDAADVRQFYTDLLQYGSLSAVVATGESARCVPSLAEAVRQHLPVYILGIVPRSLLQQLRDLVSATNPNKGVVPANPLSALVHIGLIIDDVAAAAAERLSSAGMRRVHCVNTAEGNEAYGETCRLLVEACASRGLLAEQHVANPHLVPVALMLAEIAAQGPWDEGNATALVVMDAAAYSLVNTVRKVGGVVPHAHVLVLETSVEVMADMRAGKAVTALDQPSYSQGYTAVALAAQALVTGQMLTSDVLSTPRFITGGEVTEDDMARELCRAEGFPVCGDPGVANVTASGCACFPRSDVKFQVMATLPPASESWVEVAAGLRDAQRDFPGSSFTWSTGQVHDGAGQLSHTAAVAALLQDNWTSLLILDSPMAPVDAASHAALVRIGQAKGKRSFWLGGSGDGLQTTEALVAQFSANGYIGPSPQGWASLGRMARDRLGGTPGPSVLLYTPLYVPQWVQATHNFVGGFFNNSLVDAPNFWKVPVEGDAGMGTGVWSLFGDGWASPAASAGRNASQGSPALADACRLVDQATLQIKPVPSGPAELPFTPEITDLAHGVAVARISYDGVVMGPYHAVDVPLALQALESGNATTRGGVKTRLFSMTCLSGDIQALTYPDRVPGGDRHAGCLDSQTQLATYIAYMAAVLHQQTLGESLLTLKVSTDRILTKDSFAVQQRATDCRVAHIQRPASASMFPVCDDRAGCGGNATAPPCSGHGACRFPTSDTAKGASLSPSVGWCVCHRGYTGHLCESEGHVLSRIKAGLPIPAGLLLLLLLAVVLFKWWRGFQVAHGMGRSGARKGRWPSQGQHLAVVFTDIEGSTALWEWNPEVMVEALQVHHKLLRALLPKHHGYESNTEGDAFELVFHDASDALHWAMDAQMALLHPETVLRQGRAWPHWPAPSSVCAWPADLLSHPLGAEVRGTDGSVIYRGLRVRMGIHTGVPEASYQHPNGRRHYRGKVVALARAIGDAPNQGGQVLMSLDAWVSLGISSEHAPLVVHSMGDHVLSRDLGPLGIMQVLPEPLQGRLPFRPLRSLEQLTPSFFDAPVSDSYLAGEPPRDPVAIVFTFVCGGAALKRSSAYAPSVQLLAGFMRATLHACNGYECEEKDGNFLLAFGSPLDAVVFSQQIQVGAMALPWPEELLREDDAAEVVSASGGEAGSVRDDATQLNPARDDRSTPQRVFCGLRIKTGICWSKPVRCLPHGSTGRAAYFGPLMNRAARIASSAADGQTLCNAELVEAVVAREEAERLDVSFTSLGEFSLKGIPNQVELVQVSSSRLSGRLFEPRTPSKPWHASLAGGGLVRSLSVDSMLWSPLKTQWVLSRRSFDSTSSGEGPPDVSPPVSDVSSPVGTQVLTRVQTTAARDLACRLCVDTTGHPTPCRAKCRGLQKRHSQLIQLVSPARGRTESVVRSAALAFAARL